ncbi:MAG: hypothetical protein JSS57_16390 [Proteobacteria bacterium]|nr:hypothetical protein [Pseudomonadota bacterium]
MIAVIDNTTQIVVFLFEETASVELTESGLSGAVKCPDITTTSHYLQVVTDNPDYVGGAWRFTDGQWVVADRDRYAAISAARGESERQAAFEAAKAGRAEAVAKIIVTTASGLTFDGDEDSQNRMSRALSAMTDADVLPWVLADNRVVQATRPELQEALRLAGLAMAEIWVAPYIQSAQ